jgi:hypothetical protein
VGPGEPCSVIQQIFDAGSAFRTQILYLVIRVPCAVVAHHRAVDRGYRDARQPAAVASTRSGSWASGALDCHGQALPWKGEDTLCKTEFTGGSSSRSVKLLIGRNFAKWHAFCEKAIGANSPVRLRGI